MKTGEGFICFIFVSRLIVAQYVYCSTVEAFWRCPQRYQKILWKRFVLEPFYEIDQTKDIFEEIFRNFGSRSSVKHL